MGTRNQNYRTQEFIVNDLVPVIQIKHKIFICKNNIYIIFLNEYKIMLNNLQMLQPKTIHYTPHILTLSLFVKQICNFPDFIFYTANVWKL